MKKLIAGLMLLLMFSSATFANRHEGGHDIDRSDGFCWTHSDYCGDEVDEDGFCWSHSEYEEVKNNK